MDQYEFTNIYMGLYSGVHFAETFYFSTSPTQYFNTDYSCSRTIHSIVTINFIFGDNHCSIWSKGIKVSKLIWGKLNEK